MRRTAVHVWSPFLIAAIVVACETMRWAVFARVCAGLVLFNLTVREVAGEVASNTVCLECHRDPTLTLARDGVDISLFVDGTRYTASRHGEMACTDCHSGFDGDALPHREGIEPVNCLECHADLDGAHAFHPMIDRLTQPDASPALACAGCHGTHDVVATGDPKFKFAAAKANESCGACHQAQLVSFLTSAHAGETVGLFPSCLTCHQAPIVNGDRPLLDVKLAQAGLCLSCHVDSPDAAARTRLAGRFVASWGQSVHGRALEAGEGKAASCVDCHGSHEMKRAMVADSRVNKLHITETCQTCHEAEAKWFETGVHAGALRRGVLAAPVCTDCHGEHLILAAKDPHSPVSPRNVSQELCGDCHGSVRLSQKYGLSSDRFRTFSDSFHGLAVRGRSVEVVNCASCHGAHEILRSDNPLSRVHKVNLAATCGECHPRANELFAVGSVHVSLNPTLGDNANDEPLVRLVASLYVWAIVLIVGAMLIHNGLDFFKKVRRKVRGHIHGVGAEHVPHRLYVRMTVNERLQHGTMALSFVLLVITGFMLRFPEAWWVVGMREFSDNIFEWRGLIHRIAAVVMVAAGIWHGWYVCCTARGRELICALWPRFTDLSDAWRVLRYNLGLARTKPRFERFSYIEKAEYWALLWGSVIMTLTGVLLWADETTMSTLTKLGFDLARTVHYYEAILATLAIIVWHFYAVIFNPDVYPMNLSWLTGRLSEEEMLDEHPLELERLKKLEAESDEEKPPPS